MRGKGGYVGEDSVPRLNVLDLQMQIRRLPKPVVAMVAGYAVGGGHILHMVCDLTVSTDKAALGPPHTCCLVDMKSNYCKGLPRDCGQQVVCMPQTIADLHVWEQQTAKRQVNC